MIAEVARRAKSAVKGQLKGLRQRYARAFHAFDAVDLEHSVRGLGLTAGDVVLVHSAWDAFVGFQGKPTEVIAAIQRVVTPGGTVLMPTIPFTGTAVEHVSRHPVFDVARTPSRVGLLTELFRRSAGVVRSVHPTHAVAAWGRDAVPMCRDHHEATTPCGEPSPYMHLIERDGKVLLVGADIDSLTLWHALEEKLESRLPISPFTREHFELVSRLPDGTTRTTSTRLFEPAVSRRRNLFTLMPELSRLNGWRETRLGGLKLVLLKARDVERAAVNLAEQGIFCYD